MSHSSGGPYGSDAPPPPPPGQGSGGYQGGAGYGGQDGYGGYGGYGGQGGGHDGPYIHHPDGYEYDEPPKKGRNKLLIGALIGGALLLLLCCGGVVALGLIGSSGFGSDEGSSSPQTSESATSEPTTSEPTSETSTASPSQSQSPTESESPDADAGSAGDFPDEFDGWQRSENDAGAPGGSTGAIYTKDDRAIVIVATEDAPGAMDGFKMVWSDDEDVDGGSCGRLVSQTQCASAEDGQIYVLNDPQGGEFGEVMGTLQSFLDAR